MCGRYALQTPLADLAEAFEAEVAMADPGPRFNVAPTETVPVLRGRTGGREIAGLRWGLVPNWSSGPSGLPLIINARTESLEARPAFRDLLAAHRCAVLADGFYEWRTEFGVRQPYFVRRRDGLPLALAGLWDRWNDRDSCAIVTTEANQLLLPLHDRMPVVLQPDGLTPWLDPTVRDFERVREALRPCPPDLLEAVPVPPRVNRVGEDDPTCIDPLDEPIREVETWGRRPPAGSARPSDQLGLFQEDDGAGPG